MLVQNCVSNVQHRVLELLEFLERCSQMGLHFILLGILSMLLTTSLTGFEFSHLRKTDSTNSPNYPLTLSNIFKDGILQSINSVTIK
jgi:hypothetical protein